MGCKGTGKLGALSPILHWRRVELRASAVRKERASGLVASETQSAQSGLQEAEQKWGWAHEASSRKPSWTTEAGLGLVSSGLTHLPFTAPLRPLLLQKAMSNPS